MRALLCSKTVPCHLTMFLRNSKQNSINDRICALWRLATGCYWDRTLLQVGIVCFQYRIRMQRSNAYASDDKIHFNFFLCKKSFAICNCAFCACVFVFAVALCVSFMVCCSWLILRLWTRWKIMIHHRQLRLLLSLIFMYAYENIHIYFRQCSLLRIVAERSDTSLPRTILFQWAY